MRLKSIIVEDNGKEVQLDVNMENASEFQMKAINEILKSKTFLLTSSRTDTMKEVMPKDAKDVDSAVIFQATDEMVFVMLYNLFLSMKNKDEGFGKSITRSIAYWMSIHGMEYVVEVLNTVGYMMRTPENESEIN